MFCHHCPEMRAQSLRTRTTTTFRRITSQASKLRFASLLDRGSTTYSARRSSSTIQVKRETTCIPYNVFHWRSDAHQKQNSPLQNWSEVIPTMLIPNSSQLQSKGVVNGISLGFPEQEGKTPMLFFARWPGFEASRSQHVNFQIKSPDEPQTNLFVSIFGHAATLWFAY